MDIKKAVVEGRMERNPKRVLISMTITHEFNDDMISHEHLKGKARR